jgi:hypothetical protein
VSEVSGAAWARTPSGWALNLDGSSPAGFALPRLEIEQSPRGWLCRCRFADGSSREQLDDSGSIAVAKRTAAELARGRLGERHAAALATLLG